MQILSPITCQLFTFFQVRPLSLSADTTLLTENPRVRRSHRRVRVSCLCLLTQHRQWGGGHQRATLCNELRGFGENPQFFDTAANVFFVRESLITLLQGLP